MDELLSEKEQIEQMRGWWRENGTYVIAGIVLGVGGIFGFNAWKDSQVQTRVEASTRFEELADEVAENRLDGAEAIAGSIYAEFGDTIYADQARLAMARLYMDQGRDQDAADALDSELAEGTSDQLKMVARLRLAKIYLYQNKPAEVITLLSGFENSGFAPRYSDAIGDAHFEMGDYAAAETAWQQALTQDASNGLIDATLIQMKIADLPSGDAGVAEEAPVGIPGLEDEENIEPADEPQAGPGEEPGE